MHLGKTAPKLVPSFMRRKLRLAVAHHGAPSQWTAPAKADPVERPRGKKRR